MAVVLIYIMYIPMIVVAHLLDNRQAQSMPSLALRWIIETTEEPFLIQGSSYRLVGHLKRMPVRMDHDRGIAVAITQGIDDQVVQQDLHQLPTCLDH